MIAGEERYPRARSVAVVGEFNDWRESAQPLVYDAALDEWRIELWLKPGRYEYKFLVDGRDWWNDQNAPKVPKRVGQRELLRRCQIAEAPAFAAAWR